MAVTALAAFGVLSRVDETLPVLDLADAYRTKLCAIIQEEYDCTINLRNKYFPAMLPALAAAARLSQLVYDCDKEIKQLHSDVRDRNALTEELERKLSQLRGELKLAEAKVALQRADYNANLRLFKLFWASLADWQRVKDLAKRRKLYDKIMWPSLDALMELDAVAQQKAEQAAAAKGKECTRKPVDRSILVEDWFADYGELSVAADLDRRELAQEYKKLGLYSNIRSEIEDASEPKVSRTSPGMRYFYGREPDPEAWEKITTPIPGGLTWQELQDGKLRSLRVLKSVQVPARSSKENVFRIEQQIGTLKKPKRIKYLLKVSREFPPDSVVRQWSLVVRREPILVPNRERRVIPGVRLRAVAVPVIATAMLAKPTGTGVLTYDIRWSRTASGVKVCQFAGEHVREDLILPYELMDRRTCVKEVQTVVDTKCNALLTLRGLTPQPDERQGYAALQSYLKEKPEDNAAANLFDEATLQLYRARRIEKRARRTIENIYKNVVRRVCSLHGELVIDPIKLAEIKRYATRDLLKANALPTAPRATLQACAVGKLQAMLKAYGLPEVKAKGAKEEPYPSPSQETDLFTSYVKEAAKRKRQ